jgi:tetratricopeptide (TPR) repeat protein
LQPRPYRAKNDLDRAIADYDRALQLDKNLATAYGGRARAYRSKDDLDKALADFDEAVRLQSNVACASAAHSFDWFSKSSHAPLFEAGRQVPCRGRRRAETLPREPAR